VTFTDKSQSRVPESLKPLTFDIWGSSHQIFHVLVVLAVVVHLVGIGSAFDYNYTHRRCAAWLLYTYLLGYGSSRIVLGSTVGFANFGAGISISQHFALQKVA